MFKLCSSCCIFCLTVGNFSADLLWESVIFGCCVRFCRQLVDLNKKIKNYWIVTQVAAATLRSAVASFLSFLLLRSSRTVLKIWFMYSQKWKCAASFSIPTFMNLWAITYSQDRSAYLAADRPILGHINRSQMYMNVEIGRQKIIFLFWK